MTDDDKRLALHYLGINLQLARRRADHENDKVSRLLRRIAEVEIAVPDGKHDCVWAAGCRGEAAAGSPFCDVHVAEIQGAAPPAGV